MSYSDVLDKIVWSYSSVNSYQNCPRCFFLERIQKVEKVQNAFAEWGSFMHSILERYFKGEIDIFDLLDVYEKEYKRRVQCAFPFNKYADLSSRYYEAGLNYLSNFNGLSPKFEILGIEDKAILTIGKRKFIGYIDLILRHRDTKSIVIVDHKSKSSFKNQKELNEYLRQLYLYSLYVKEKYGEYPESLMFNMVRAGDKVSHPFSEDRLNEAVDWFLSTIDLIYSDLKFEDKISIEYERKFKDISTYRPGDDFFCSALCGARNFCERSGRMKSDQNEQDFF